MPQEVLDEVVDYAADDTTAQMGSCALVCRSLRSRAQRHLFNDISIVTTERIIQLINLIQANPLISKYLDKVHASSRQFIPIYGVDTALASLFLLVKKLAPYSSLYMLVTPDTSATRNSHPWPMNHISQEQVLYSLSGVNRLEIIDVTDFPTAALFNFRRLSSLIYDNTTSHPSLLTIFSPQRMSPLPPSFFQNITHLEIISIAKFPGILISNCHALTHLTLCATTLWRAEATAVSSRPKITHLTIAKFDLEMIKTLVDAVVDLSRLRELYDETDFNHYEDTTLEDYQEINQCYQHLLSESRYSLVSLFIFCSTWLRIIPKEVRV